FYRVTRAVFIGGGRYNVVENNVFVDCKPALHLDDRGTTRIRWKAGRRESWDLEAKLSAYNWKQPPWSTRYPHLVNILDDQPALPLHNRVAHNLVVGGSWLSAAGQRLQRLLQQEGNVITDADPGFIDPARLDFRLRPESRVWKESPKFQQVPLEKMGLYAHELRASWPVTKPPLEGGLAPKAAPEPRPELPVYRVPRTPGGIAVDGHLTEEEWLPADAADPITIATTPAGRTAAPPSRGLLMAGSEALYVAIDNEVNPAQGLRLGNTWGQCDAVEVAIQVSHGGGKHVLPYRGYANGAWELSDEAGAAPEVLARGREGVKYAARVVGPGRWVAEWAIPWRALGIAQASGMKIPFNLSVRKTAGNQWLMWRGTKGRTWNVENAGFIQLP
ncbi:MAG: hypothetical protein QHJ73_19430, partial [Armatimonadota bacterium]|nr:hypothetical protein [Armatimonadota bacterium]